MQSDEGCNRQFQGSVKSAGKIQVVNILSFVGHKDFAVTTTQFCSYSGKAAIDNM